MTTKHDIELALKTRIDTYVPCSYCRATEGKTADEIVDRVLSCNNCLIDIQCRGEWSGAGMKALQMAYEKSPDNPNWPIFLEGLGLLPLPEKIKEQAGLSPKSQATKRKKVPR